MGTLGKRPGPYGRMARGSPPIDMTGPDGGPCDAIRVDILFASEGSAP
jgi:hypothetical protein